MSSLQRWNKEIKCKVAVPQYNKGMGGVDLADQNIATYRIAIKSKKWWWAFFVGIPDMVMQNSWLLYRKSKGPDHPNFDLLAFRREIVDVYLKNYASSRTKPGRPRGRILPAKRRVNYEIRYDWIEHYQSSLEKQRRCGLCGKNTQRFVDIGLHNHYFKEWHNYE